MAARNYQPTLRILARRLQSFMVRYQALIEQGLTTEQALVFAALLDKIEEMVSVLGTGGGV